MTDLRWPTYGLRNLTLEAMTPDGAGGSMHLVDEAGTTYLDAVTGVGCAPLGHAHPLWVEAIHHQLQRLSTAANSFFTRPQQQLAARLADLFPIDDARSFFANSGTESTEAAIKLALRATGRDTIVAFSRAFHGRSSGALALTANAKYREPYVRCLGEDAPERFLDARVLRLPFGDRGAVEEAFAAEGGRIAAVFIEPVQGEGGIYPASRDFLVFLREITRRHGALLGADEVQSGCGRTGNWAAWTTIVGDDPELRPDLMWLAKALGGGFPIGVCLARGELAAAMGSGTHGTTFGGNPLACAAALATLRIIEEEGLMAKAAAQATTIAEIAAASPIARVKEIRASGSMIGIQIGEPAEQAAAPLAMSLMHEHRILVTICGGHTVRLLFPYRAGAAELGEVWRALAATFAERAS
ncbi:MAG: aminotransferase class III-fold pyridoxal phosphate-dependent enzyme [Myxococcales bacterium]|nr:aminotransferase class III-fold pyridoxal phosphate-dependent enzyme [Myxococcales bacterium]MCB9704464.1 aminotransferase class III-fold pyridoxal phosphate-dependent enzyme [Myxococcales bacterium]